MKIRAVLLSVALAAFGWVGVPATTALMPLDEVKPGMVGTGQTGLEGGPLAETGVIAGMSGSPVYVDGRLIGAVSYAIGSFPKEPIAGITPIREMIDATADSTRRAAAAAHARIDLPITRDGLAAAVRAS